MVGFTSAQTSNESRQDANTQGDPLALGRKKITDFPLHLWNRLNVTHMWKHNPGGMLGGRIKSHHSLIMVSRPGFSGNPTPVFYIDLVLTPKTGRAWVRVFKASERGIDGYTASTSYSPNPVVKSGNELLAAYDHAVGSMAERYDTLTNNCQKFARIFMTRLGAKHNRHFFHISGTAAGACIHSGGDCDAATAIGVKAPKARPRFRYRRSLIGGLKPVKVMVLLVSPKAFRFGLWKEKRPFPFARGRGKPDRRMRGAVFRLQDHVHNPRKQADFEHPVGKTFTPKHFAAHFQVQVIPRSDVENG